MLQYYSKKLKKRIIITPNQLIKKIKIKDNIKQAIIFTFIFGLLTHFFILTNKLINHDDLEQLVSNMDYSSSGRWFLQVGNLPSSAFSMPWVNGLFIILYTAILAAIIIYLFDIKNKFNIALLSAFMIMFPTNSALFHYTNSYDAYLFGAVLGAIGILLFTKYKYGFIGTIILTVFAIASYQSFFGLLFGIIVVYYLLELIKGKISSKEYLRTMLRVLACYLGAVILYIISTKYLLNIELSDYQNIDKIGSVNFSTIFRTIPRAYGTFFQFLLQDSYSQFGYIKYLNIIFLISTLYLCFLSVKDKKFEEQFFVLINLLALPLIVNLIILMAPTSAIGLRQLSAYLVYYGLAVALIDIYGNKIDLGIQDSNNIKNKKLVTAAIWAISLTMIASLYQFYIVTNKVYMTLEIDSTNVLSYTTRVISDIENHEAYDRKKAVYFVGSPDITTPFTEKYTTPDVLKSAILSKKLPANALWPLYPERYAAFPNKIILMWGDYYRALADKNLQKDISEMPIYPEKGSIKELKGSIFIKFKQY